MKSLSPLIMILLLTAAMPAICFSQKKFTYKDGSSYFGEMKGGLPEGTGTVFYANGDLYRGDWKDHAPHGLGTMYWVSSNSKLTGIWDAGKPVQILPVENASRTDLAWPTIGAHPARIWAVVVGVGRYSSMPALDFADDDAYQFFSFLKSPQGGALPAEQISLLIDENATRTNILQALQTSVEAAGENDMVLFYYSGHGLPEAFLPADYDGYNNRLLYEEINELLRSCKANHKLVIADACNAGGLITKNSSQTKGLEEMFSALDKGTGSTALLLSSRWYESSFEDGQLRSGVFSHFLLMGLNGEADLDGNRVITIAELHHYVNQRVRRHTNFVQTPFLTGNFDHTMPVAAVKLVLSDSQAGF